MKRVGLAILALLVSLTVAAAPVLGLLYTSWLQFQGDAAHSGSTFPVVGGLNGIIDTSDESADQDNCRARSSPAAWSEERAANARLQFVVWTRNECIRTFQGGGTLANIAVQAGDFASGTSAWEDLSKSGLGGAGTVWRGFAGSSSPVVFFLDDAPPTLTTTRIVTMAESGALEISSLGWNAGGFITPAQECVEGAGYASGNTHDFISPVLYKDPFWGSADGDANPDSYVYVARENLVGGQIQVDVRSYDMYGIGNGASCDNNPTFLRYTSQALVGRILTMSTPAIILQRDVRLEACANAPDEVVKYPWKPDPINPIINPPIVDLPPWVLPRPIWPQNCVWIFLQVLQGPFLILATTDVNGANPQVHAFNVDPNSLVNGQYPLQWTLAVSGVVNNAVTALDRQSVIGPQNKIYQLEAAVVTQDDGKATFIYDLQANPPTWVSWTIDPALASPIRSSATQVTNRLVVIPWADTAANPANLLKMAVFDMATNLINPKHTMVFQNVGPAAQTFTLSVTANWITASGIFAQGTTENDQGKEFYIGIEEDNGPNPGAGLLSISYANIFNNAFGSLVYLRYVPAAVEDWEIYSTPALVGTDEQGHTFDFLFIETTYDCHGVCPGLQGIFYVGHLVSFTS